MIKLLYRRMKYIRPIKATSLVSYARFDIPAKTIYARAILKNVDSKWPATLYREHLRVWNGFWERDPVKRSFKDYDEAFRTIILHMQNDTYKASKSPVGVTKDNQLFDGSHRVAAAIVTDTKLKVTPVEKTISKYSYTYFKDRDVHVKHGLAKKYMDAMALEYIRITPRHPYMILLFPSSHADVNKVEKLISETGDIVYKKNVEIEEKGIFNLIHQVYDGEIWNTSEKEKSVRFKAESCFPKGKGEVYAYLLDSHVKHDEIIRLKTEIRNLCNTGKHSVHITDTKKEAFSVASLFFNDNSLHLINNASDWRLPSNFNEMFDTYRGYLGVMEEDICIDSSSTLALYGLRDARDIDYLWADRSVDMIPQSSNISNHNQHAHWYTKSIDDIIYNPENHLYYKGKKFVSLSILREMKKNRNEEKDKNDIKLIDKIKKL